MSVPVHVKRSRDLIVSVPAHVEGSRVPIVSVPVHVEGSRVVQFWPDCLFTNFQSSEGVLIATVRVRCCELTAVEWRTGVSCCESVATSVVVSVAIRFGLTLPAIGPTATAPG